MQNCTEASEGREVPHISTLCSPDDGHLTITQEVPGAASIPPQGSAAAEERPGAAALIPIWACLIPAAERSFITFHYVAVSPLRWKRDRKSVV